MLEFVLIALAQTAAGEPQTSAPAQPAAFQQTASTEAQVEVAAEDRIICMRVLRTGSRVPQRRCLTAREQEEVRSGARQTVRAIEQVGLLRH